MELLADESESDYLFANPDTGPPYTNVGKAFAAACKGGGMQDLTFHDLRHTFASRLREAGVDAITRRDLLGHSTVEMSDDYTHSSVESRLRAVESIANLPQGGLQQLYNNKSRLVLVMSNITVSTTLANSFELYEH